MRKTKQKEAMRKTLEAAKGLLSAQEVYDHSKQILSSLGLATVYRLIKKGLSDGWIQKVNLPGKESRYELKPDRPHHYFECRSCLHIFQLTRCVEDFSLMLPEGFKLESHEVTLYGTCKRCS